MPFMTSELIISKIKAQDLAQIILIENASFSTPWKESYFLAELSLENSKSLKASINTANGEKILGYIILRNFVNEIHILNLAVHPEYKRSGIASSLLEYTITKLCNNLVIILEVRVSNLAAQKLYRKFAFFELQRRKGYYPDGEDAIVMAKGDFGEN